MSAVRKSLSLRRNGHSQWEYDHQPTGQERRRSSVIVAQWERDTRPAWRKSLSNVWQNARRHSGTIALVGFAFTLGFAFASGPESATANIRLRDRLRVSQNTVTARQGELGLMRLEQARLNRVMENSQRYHIPAGLAASIYDIALAEGIEPRVAYGLVSIESDFLNKAISPVGAVGLTQLMPNTARFFEPGIQRADLFDPETNLRIGFRFLRELIAKYDGDVDRALHAYNRGPTVVDRIVKQGGDPANGYAELVKSAD